MLKFSVITVSYNQGQYIRENIESVLHQGYSNYEHIIIDGGSTDNTLDILKEYPHLNWVSEPDRGQSDGLNKGFRKATGDIIAWINSDDALAPEAMKVLNDFFENNPDKSVVTGNQIIIDGESNFVERIPAETFTADHLLNERSSVMQNSTFFRKEVLDSVGLLDESFHYTMDHELFLRIAKQYTSYSIPVDLAYFRLWEDSKTCTSQIKFFKEQLRMRRFHGAKLLSSGNLWIIWQFIKEPFKRCLPLRNAVRRIKGVKPIKK